MARTKKEVELENTEVKAVSEEISVLAEVTLTSLNMGSVDGVIYPNKLKLVCEFSGTPDVALLRVTAPKGWIKEGTPKVEGTKVTYTYMPPEKEDKTGEFTAQYNGGELKKLVVPVILAPNIFDKVTTDKESYFKGETIQVVLDYRKEIDFERDKPFLENIPEGVTKLTGPVKDRDYICYTFSADTVGEKEFTFSCFKSKPNQTSRKVKVKIEEAPESIKYRLNGYNFTAVGNTFLNLCKPEIAVKFADKNLIDVAEEQVKLGVLKIVKE